MAEAAVPSKEKKNTSGRRKLQGVDRTIVQAVAIAAGLYHVYIAVFGIPEAYLLRSLHVGVILFLSFTLYPVSRKLKNVNRVAWYDWAFALLSLASTAYVYLDYERIVWRRFFIDPVTAGDWFFAVATVLLILEATRRTVGLALPILACVFLAYILMGPVLPDPLYHPGMSLSNMVDYLFLTKNAIYGSLVSLSATFIFAFILFGAMLNLAKGDQLFMKVALGATRNSVGGPAKAAVIGSGLFGSISGSPTANVFATGVITIPLMMRAGFTPVYASAVEAVSSSLGQVIPPVMGATAFLIAEFSGKPYLDVAMAAVGPAVLYVVATYLMVHYNARRTGIGVYRSGDEEPLRKVFLRLGHLVIPLAVLVALLIEQYTAYYAACVATFSVVAVGFLRKETRISLKDLVGGLELTLYRLVPVATALICASVAVGALQTTGTIYRFIAVITTITGGEMFIGLVLIAIAVIILGMGLPISAAFIIVSLFGAPALAKFGVDPFVAYYFVFLFALTSTITPPVCMASYAAASVSGASYMKVGGRAFILGLAGYVVPFLVVYRPSLLIGQGYTETLYSMFIALVGVFALAGAVEGWLVRRANLAQRIILGFGAATLLWPHHYTDIVGLAAMAVVIVWQVVQKLEARKAKQPDDVKPLLHV